MKKILIKASEIIPYRNGMLAGVGRSTIELIKQFIDINDPDVDFSISTSGIKGLFFDYYSWPLKHYTFPFYLHESTNFSAKLETFIRKNFIKPDLFHITNNFDTTYPNEKFVVTIHDMILYDKDPSSRETFKNIATKSKAIVTCSSFSKNDIIAKLHVPEEKISVIPWGINKSIFFKRDEKQIQNICGKYKIETPYFFSCSCGDKRKNIDIAIEAFSLVLKDYPNATFVISWGNCPAAIQEKFQNEIKANRLKIIQGVSNDDLAALYSGALATYFISSAEGFGFPMIESFACGTPCVSCYNTSLMELGQNHAYFVPERNIEETKKSMIHFLDNKFNDKNGLIEYAQKFDWKETAQKYIDFYKNNL